MLVLLYRFVLCEVEKREKVFPLDLPYTQETVETRENAEAIDTGFPRLLV